MVVASSRTFTLAQSSSDFAKNIIKLCSQIVAIEMSEEKKLSDTISTGASTTDSANSFSQLGLEEGACREDFEQTSPQQDQHDLHGHHHRQTFSSAFARRNSDLNYVLNALEQYCNQLEDLEEDNPSDWAGESGNNTSLRASTALIKHMLVETQGIFHSMIEENKLIGSRIDSSLDTAQLQVSLIKEQLINTQNTVSKMAATVAGSNQKRSKDASVINGEDLNHCQHPEGLGRGSDREEKQDTEGSDRDRVKGSGSSTDESSSDVDGDISMMSRDQLLTLCQRVSRQRSSLRRRNRSLHAQLSELRANCESSRSESARLTSKLKSCETEILLTKEALAALKADRKKLKMEKFDLLNQMKELYQTLEDKEKELRDFIRNYEQRIKEADDRMRSATAGQEQTEREKWNILKHARDQTERSVGLSAELDSKEGQLKQVSEELYQLRRRLSCLGYSSDHELSSSLLQPTYATIQRPCSAHEREPGLVNGHGPGEGSVGGARVGGDGSVYERASGVGRVSDNVSDSTASGEAGHYASAANRGVSLGQRVSPALSPVASPVIPPAVATSPAISKSAEQLDDIPPLTSKLRQRSAFRQAAWGSISRVFSRHKPHKQFGRAKSHSMGYSCAADVLGQCDAALSDELYSEKLQLLEQAQQLPMERWRAAMVIAWLQVTLGMPQYGPACSNTVRSGKMMLDMSDSDLQRNLGIHHPMHRRKLRLAIEELRQPYLCQFPYISQLNHVWVSSEWLPQLGLSQYAELSAACLLDGRMLASLTKKDMEKHLSLTKKFDQVSLMHGIQLLRMLRFDRRIINERRQCSEAGGTCDLLMWTNADFISWVQSIDLAEYAANLKDSGIHGALVMFESGFTADTMAMALRLPVEQAVLRRHLTNELGKLLNSARLLMEQEAPLSCLQMTDSRNSPWDKPPGRGGRQRPAATATLGRAFSRSCAGGLQANLDKDRRNSSLRGSLSRALGLSRTYRECDRTRFSVDPYVENTCRITSAPSPLLSTCDSLSPSNSSPPDRPRSVVTSSAGGAPPHPTVGEPSQTQRHRRIKSISDIETITVTPV